MITRVAYDISYWTAFLVNTICHHLLQFPHLHKEVIYVRLKEIRKGGTFAFALNFEIRVSVFFPFSLFVFNLFLWFFFYFPPFLTT